MSDLNLEQKEDAMIIVDNQAVLAISHNLVFHEKLEFFLLKRAKGWYCNSCILQNRGAHSLYLTTSKQVSNSENET